MSGGPVASLHDATLAFGDRVLWQHLTLDVAPAEFIGILGPNGAGKSSLLKVLLGQLPLTSGTALIDGAPVHRGSPRIGYVPQQGSLPSSTSIRGRDLVGLGLDGHRWGIGLRHRERRIAIDHALEVMGAMSYADVPIAQLSGGERQRLRIAQALVTEPSVLLCDEPLLSLDMRHQQAVAEAVDHVRAHEGAAVLFVTHEINPILPLVDRVLYLVQGQAKIGTVDEVMHSRVLSELFGSPIEVIRRGGRILVIGGDEPCSRDHEHDDEAGGPHA